MPNPKPSAGHAVAFIHADPPTAGSMIRLVQAAGMRGQLFGSVDAFLADEDRAEFTSVVVDASLMDNAVYARLRGSRGEEDSAPLPVIAISRTDDLQARQIARQSGASAFFREPLDGETLLDAIQWELSNADLG